MPKTFGHFQKRLIKKLFPEMTENFRHSREWLVSPYDCNKFSAKSSVQLVTGSALLKSGQLLSKSPEQQETPEPKGTKIHQMTHRRQTEFTSVDVLEVAVQLPE